MLPVSLLKWLSELWIGDVLRNSAWMLPTIESAHMASYSAIFGSMLVRNLRAFGLGIRMSSVEEIGCQLRRWMLGGLGVSLVTGTLLLLYEPSRFGVNLVLGYKAALILAAAVFEFGIRNKPDASPLAGKRSAVISTALWLGVALAGLALSLS